MKSLLYANHHQQEDSLCSRERPSPQPVPYLFVLRHLLDEDTFTENFRNDNWPPRTYLCYQVECPGQDSGVPPGQDKGVLRNKVTCPARSQLTWPPSPGTFRVEASGWT